MNNKRTVLALPLLALLALSVFCAVEIGLSDIYISRADTELSFWDRQNYQPRQARVSAVQQNIARALAAWPGNPDYLDARARLLTWRAYWHEDAAVAQVLYQQAIASKLAGLARRPARRQGWRELAGQLARSGQFDATWTQALEKLDTLPRVQP